MPFLARLLLLLREGCVQVGDFAVKRVADMAIVGCCASWRLHLRAGWLHKLDGR